MKGRCPQQQQKTHKIFSQLEQIINIGHTFFLVGGEGVFKTTTDCTDIIFGEIANFLSHGLMGLIILFNAPKNSVFISLKLHI